MRGYWIRILLGALGIFVVGSIVISVVRRRVIAPARDIVHSADPIRIPLAFIPFVVNGSKYGTFQRLTIERDAPDLVRALHLRVRLADSIPPTALADCRLTVVSATRFEPSEGFRCLASTESDSALVSFGEVLLRGRGEEAVTIALLLPQATVQALREEGSRAGQTHREILRAEEAAARAAAQRALVEAGLVADSIQAALRQRQAPPPAP